MVHLGCHLGSSQANLGQVGANVGHQKDGNHDSHLLKLVGGASCHDHGPFCFIYAMVAARRATKQAATIAYIQQNGGRSLSRKSAPPFCCIYAVVAARRATKQAATTAYMQQNGGRPFS